MVTITIGKMSKKRPRWGEKRKLSLDNKVHNNSFLWKVSNWYLFFFTWACSWNLMGSCSAMVCFLYIYIYSFCCVCSSGVYEFIKKKRWIEEKRKEGKKLIYKKNTRLFLSLLVNVDPGQKKMKKKFLFVYGFVMYIV